MKGSLKRTPATAGLVGLLARAAGTGTFCSDAPCEESAREVGRSLASGAGLMPWEVFAIAQHVYVGCEDKDDLAAWAGHGGVEALRDAGCEDWSKIRGTYQSLLLARMSGLRRLVTS